MNLKPYLFFLILCLVGSCTQTDSIAKYRKLKRLGSADVLQRAKNNQLIYHYAKFKNVHGEELNEKERDQLNRGQLAKDYYINQEREIVEIRVRPMTLDDKFLEIQVRNIASYKMPDSLSTSIDCDRLPHIVTDLWQKQPPDFFNTRSFETFDTIPSQRPFDETSVANLRNRRILHLILSYCDFPDQAQLGAAPMEDFLKMLRNNHSDLMGYFYEKIKVAAENGKLEKKHFAVIQDRLLMLHGFPQLYGSQIFRGELHLIEAPEKVNERRATVGLRPIEEYLEEQGMNFAEQLLQMEQKQS